MAPYPPLSPLPFFSFSSSNSPLTSRPTYDNVLKYVRVVVGSATHSASSSVTPSSPNLDRDTQDRTRVSRVPSTVVTHGPVPIESSRKQRMLSVGPVDQKQNRPRFLRLALDCEHVTYKVPDNYVMIATISA